MSPGPNFSLTNRRLGVALSVVVAALAARGEPIRFSTPAVPLVAPAREQVGLPEARSKGFGFEPEINQPMPQVRSAPVRIITPRDDQDRDMNDRRWTRDSRMFPEPNDKLTDKPVDPRAMAPEKKRSPWLRENLGMKAPETVRSLAPVDEFGWDPRKAASPKNAFTPATAFGGNQREDFIRSPFATLDERNRKIDSTRSSPMFDTFGAQLIEKERLTAGQKARAAEFHQMLNPAAGPARVPGALEPVVAVAGTANRNTPLTAPTLGGLTPAQSRLDAGLADPMTAFNRQNTSVRVGGFSEFDKKPAAPAIRPQPASSIEANFAIPLNRQPTTREFPKRKF